MMESKTLPSRKEPPIHLSSAFSSATLPRVPARSRTLLVIGPIVILCLLTFAGSTRLSPHLLPSISRNPAYLIIADHGAVATENKQCSDIGVNALKDGGNAVDAAISAALCIGVVNMFSAGIGGGGFMTVRIPLKEPRRTSEVFTVNFREAAPGGAYKTMYVNDPSAAIHGGLSVGVPSELRGFEEAHRRWGNLEWPRLVYPSAELALGWTVDMQLAKMIQEFADLMLFNPDWSAIFAPEGKLLLRGRTIRRINYSRTLETIADEGPGAFYKGPIANSIIRKISEAGGIVTPTDFESYTVEVERALQGTYHDKKVYTANFPACGPVLLHMLNLLEQYDLANKSRTTVNVHRIVEAIKFGFAARSRIGDPTYYSGNRSRMYEIPTKEFASSIAVNLTDDRTHPAEYYNSEFDVKIDHGTSHISVVDKDGMAVALTSTVNWYFGSQVLDPETGVILNDQMDGFSVPGTSNGFGLGPFPYNYPEPGKRPVSSTAPTILEHSEGSLYLAIGASGGTAISTAILQALLNLDWGLDASQAIEHGRVHNQLYPDEVSAENILPTAELNGLWKRGHNVKVLDIDRNPVAVQTVVSKDGKLYAASDSRKQGIAAGY